MNPISIVAADFNGDGTLQAPQHVTIPGLPFGLAAADFNKDDKQTLL